MLDDWERQQLSGIERELSTDRSLSRVLAPPNKGQCRRVAFRGRFYPTGYFVCALTYVVMAMGAGQRLLLGGALTAGLTTWIIVEVRAIGAKDFVRGGLRGLGT